MFTRQRSLGITVRTALGMVVAATMLSVVTGLATSSPADAAAYHSAAPSAFCHALFNMPKVAPKGTSPKDYQTWAKYWLPWYQKLASTAPNTAVKSLLNQVVVVLKYEANGSNLKSVTSYYRTHSKQWVKASRSLANAFISCARSMG